MAPAAGLAWRGPAAFARAGVYFVQGRAPDHLLEGEVKVAPGQSLEVADGALRRVAYARLVRKGGSAREAAAGPLVGYTARTALANGRGLCHGAFVGFPVAFESLSVTPRAHGCLGGFANDRVRASSDEAGVDVKLAHAWDLPAVTLDLGVAGGVSVLRQSFESRGLAPPRTSAAGVLGVLLGATFDLTAGFYLSAELGAQTYLYRQREAPAGRALRPSFALRQSLGLGMMCGGRLDAVKAWGDARRTPPGQKGAWADAWQASHRRSPGPRGPFGRCRAVARQGRCQGPATSSLLRGHAAEERGGETMRKPPGTDHDPTWAPQSVIESTSYLVRRQLGRGGMGSVYEVEHLETRLVYAFKVLSTRVAEHPALAERVVREAEFLSLVKGAPHVVTLLDWGRLGDAYRRPFLVMERLYGETLAARLARGALPFPEALSCIRQALVGLAAVHCAGGVHRDVKPSNLFVQHGGLCTLLDFGVMKAISEIGLSPRLFRTDKNVPIGTPLYMAPEVASRSAVDHRADLFSVGLVLAECLLGVRLLSHLSEREYLTRLINDGVPSLELVGGEKLPVEVRRLVRRATMLNPAHRFANALAFIAEIDRIADALGLGLHPTPPRVPFGPGAGSPPRLVHPQAPTQSASTPVVPSAVAGAARGPLSPSELVTPVRIAPSALSPSELATPVRGASSALWTPSAWPTPVDSVSPTRVKTPAPASGDERTPPPESQRRRRWRGLLWGRLGRAPGGAPTLPVGSSEPPTTVPVPPRSAVSRRLPRLRDRLAPLPDSEATPANDVPEGPAPVGALAAPAHELPAEPKPAAPSPRARRVPPVSAVALGAAGVVAGAVASLAGVWWAGPPAAVVRVAPEPRRAAPAALVEPAPSAPEAPPEPPAEPPPPEASPPARPASPPASPARGDRRAQLEAKLQRGRGTAEDVEEFLILCFRAGDEPCVRRAQAFRKRLEGRR
ncbi:MAG TPA: protein kinase [Polyangiaceae bacterium]|nr:protein kinase [Polyangiaceae bacterium]